MINILNNNYNKNFEINDSPDSVTKLKFGISFNQSLNGKLSF